MADIGIGIGMNLRPSIGIWDRYEFWVSVSGISFGIILGYRYQYESSAGIGIRVLVEPWDKCFMDKCHSDSCT